jgi:hypothetical protein
MSGKSACEGGISEVSSASSSSIRRLPSLRCGANPHGVSPHAAAVAPTLRQQRQRQHSWVRSALHVLLALMRVQVQMLLSCGGRTAQQLELLCTQVRFDCA